MDTRMGDGPAFLRRSRRGIFQSAAALSAVSFCGSAASGRCVSVFYAQAGRNSWAGILVSGIIYAFLMGGIARLKRRNGAGSLPTLYAAVVGRRTGRLLTLLHGLLYAFALCMLADSAGNAAALMLPVHHAKTIGACAALTAALMISAGGAGKFGTAGLAVFLLITGFYFALLIYGRMPQAGEMSYYVELKLENAPWAAALLALVHACLAAVLGAAAAVRLFPMHLKAYSTGMIAAAAFALPLLIGNGIFALFPGKIIALQQPFAALSGEWGAIGYYICAALRWLEGTICIAGILCILPEKSA